MNLSPSLHPLLRRGLLAAAAVALLSSVAAPVASASEPAASPPAASAEEHAAGTGPVVTWSPTTLRFEAASPERAAILVEELRRALEDGLAERLRLAPGETVARRTAGGLLRARVPARLLDLSTVGVAKGTPAAGGPVLGTITLDPARQLGTHRESGDLLLFTPDPVQPGSTVGHWDPIAFPHLLMEPSINSGLPFLGLDITPDLMADIGWPLTGGGAPPGVEFSVFDLDPPGTGFTDPRPFPGAPGNPAATLGEARANLFEAVLGAWGTALASATPVDVLVSWQPLPCQAGFGAVLGGAAPLFVVAVEDEGLLPFTDTWYPIALGEALAGSDLSGPPEEGGGDIVVVLNSALDEGCLGQGTGLYYGLDGTPPPTRIDLAPVVLHELGHGLGFTSFVDETTGEELQGLPGVYDRFVFDQDLGRPWPELTDQERLFSAINFRDVTWSGAAANEAADDFLDFGVPELEITAPPEVAGSYEIGTAVFGPPVPDGGLAGRIVCMVDAPELPEEAADGLAERTTLNGCAPAENAARLEGRIALIDRGLCSFVEKVRNAQAAGAVGVIIANRSGDVPPILGGTGAEDITIPAVSVGASDGNRIREAACPRAAALLQDRFQVTVRWKRTLLGGQEQEGNGQAVPISDNAAWFYFARPDNPQLLVKIVNGCGLPVPRFWVLAGGVTNQEVWITINDTRTGASVTYRNPAGVPFDTILDTDAFDTCP